MEPKQIEKVIFILADRTYKMSSYQICSYRSTANLCAVVLLYLTHVRHASNVTEIIKVWSFLSNKCIIY
jgi:hypothetical protein